jgi:RHS repeat-associated protein
MKVKRLILFFIINCLFISIINSQSVITLNTAHTGTHSKVARDAVIMNPGFSYVQSSGNSFTAKIDKSIILYATYLGWSQIPDPATKQINTSLPVGSTPGSFDVSASGGSSYSIPVFTPQGTNGMQPGLSIVYNSQGGDGLLGVGWNIAGLSAITRVNKPYYIDGNVKGVNMDPNDSYAIDGNRMILTYDNFFPLYDLDTFKTEIATFNKIVSHNLSGYGPWYFDAILQNGTIIQYGKEALSSIKANDSTVLVWNITKITDLSGNYCEYIYGKDSQTSQRYLQKIRYTGNTNTSLQPYNEIYFTYERKTDYNEIYYPGVTVSNKLLISRIEALTDGVVVRRYDLKYAYDQYTHLVEIVESGMNGLQMNSTIFKWGDASVAYNLIDSPIISPDSSVFTSGDFNGDARLDYITVPKKTDPYTSSDKWKLYLNSVSGYSLSDSGYLDSHFKEFVIADPDNNGSDDVFWKSEEQINNGFYEVRFYCYSLSNNNLERTTAHDKLFYSQTTLFSLIPGDFDGNGESDYLYLYLTKNIKSFENLAISSIPALSTPDAVFLIDFNGNGKTDILTVKNDQINIIEYDATTQSFSSLVSNYTFDFFYGFYPGDYNGDGKTDILLGNLSIDNQFTAKILYSTGKGFVSKPTSISEDLQTTDEPPDPQYWPATIVTSINNFELLVNDFNSDGKSDVLMTKHYTEREYDQYYGIVERNLLKEVIYLSSGTYLNYNLVNYQECVSPHFYQQIDNNYDGNPDFLLTYNNEGDKAVEFYPNDQRHLIKSVTDGINFKVEFNYLSLTDTSVYKTESQSYSFPVRQFNAPIKVVSSVKTYNNNIKDYNNNPLLISESKYQYSNLKLHLQGKGVLGFTKFITDNITTHQKSINQFDFDTVFFNSYLSGQKSYLNDNFISETVNNQQILHEDVSAFGKIIQPYIASSISYDKVNNISVKKTQNLNSFWYLSYSTTSYLNNSNAVVKKDSVVFTNYNNKGQPGLIASYKSRNGETVLRNKTISYLSSGLVNTETEEFDSIPDITSTYSYNVFGIPKYITINSGGISRTDSTIYESDRGRFIVKKNNPLNQYTEFTYDILGDLLTEKSFTELTTGYVYDGLGNLKEKRLAAGSVILNTYGWSVNSLGIGDLYYTKTESPGKPTTYEYYDIFDRKIRSKAQGFDGTYLVSDQEYDSQGRPDKVYSPYFEGSSRDQYIDYDYDSYNRKTAETFTPGSIATQYTYDPLKVTITKAGQTTVKESDASGVLIKSTDEGGIIQYIYDPEDKVKQIDSPSGTTSIEYDESGNQKSLEDIDAGIINYTYNTLGDLISQHDAKGNQTTLRYDTYGRLLSRVWNNADSIFYAYNGSNGLIDNITSVIASEQVVHEFVYDNLQRLLTKKEKINNVWYTAAYTYNGPTGTIDNVYYSSSVNISYVYNQYGYLDQVKANNQLIWDAASMNRYGIVNSFTLGNQAGTSIQYDQYGLLDKIITTRNGNYLQNWDYDFNHSTGNLTKRTGLKSNGSLAEETFTYDDLNRLTSSAIGQNTISLSYDNNGKGNIENKTDVGDYFYNAGIHRLDSLSNPSSLLQGLPDQVIEYTRFNKVSKITHEPDSSQVRDLFLYYGPDQQRVKTVYKVNNSTVKTKYFALGLYEKEVDSTGTVRELYYISSPNGIVAAYQKKNSQDSIFYIHADLLGSFDVISKSDGSVRERNNFDPWGRRRNPADWTYNNVPTAFFLDRGFTGHEHLDQFDLINMNGRVYDPILALFLSPDNALQAPDNSQNFNRYAYCLNNPLVYTDPSGDFFIIDSWLIGLFSGGFKEANKRAWNDIKIWGGLFASDPNKGFLGRVWETISRFTWQLPQTIGGWGTAQAFNTLGLKGGVESVKYKYGATVVSTRGDWTAVTQGSYIVGDRSLKADEKNPLFQHEYGHYIQSQSSGWFYYSKYGIPSLLSKKPYDLNPVEQDANVRAFNYFSAEIDNFNWSDDSGQHSHWNQYSNPINDYNWSLSFNDDSNQHSLINGRLKLAWWDYLMWPCNVTIVGMIVPGLWNTLITNQSY